MREKEKVHTRKNILNSLIGIWIKNGMLASRSVWTDPGCKHTATTPEIKDVLQP